MGHNGHLCVMASEESADIIPIPGGGKKGKIRSDVRSAGWIVQYRRQRQHRNDFLDSSQNHKPSPTTARLEDCLQKGSDQIAAGYFIYGSSTMMVYTTGHGVHGFTLDPSLGEFLLSHENIRTPDRGRIYSINEGNMMHGTRERGATSTT